MTSPADIYAPGGLVEQMIADNERDASLPEGQHPADKLVDAVTTYLHEKRIATLTARCALQGWSLCQLADGTFLASNGAAFHKLQDTIAVAVFLEMLALPATSGH